MKIALISFFSFTAQEDQDLQAVQAFQTRLRNVVERVKPAFVFCGGGSAVCISKDGYILSNHHVAGPTGKEWKVFFTSGKHYRAHVVGHDPHGDISLLKVDTDQSLPFAELGDSDKLKIGQHVFALGNPFLLGNGQGAVAVPGSPGRSDGNWEPTTTLGIVSAMHRYQDWYMDAIHTDCQINPGNSGGPLFSLDGRVVGVNGRIGVRFFNRVNTGIGYAISSSQINRYLLALKKGGRVWHGEIDGLVLPPQEDEPTSDHYGQGVLVVGVERPSSASDSGLKPGDLIQEIGGYRVVNQHRYFGIVRSFPEGETVPMRVKRGDEVLELKVWLRNPHLHENEQKK